MNSWRDKPVRVQARLVPRYLWTTASIDAFLGDRCILRTGGQLKLTGSYSGSFIDGDSEHQVELSWGLSGGFRFPYQLRIDSILVGDSRVQVENWYMVGIPAVILGALLVLFFGFVFWLNRLLKNPPGGGAGPTNFAFLGAIVVGRVPSRGASRDFSTAC